MAIKQTISLEGLQQVTQELKSLADVGESAFGRIRAAVEGGGGGLEAIASNILKVGGALTSLTGALTVFGGITAGLIGLTVSASNAGEEFENLGVALGTTTEEASALISSFARAGADIDGLAQSLRRAATNISQEFAKIQESVRQANLKAASDNLAVIQGVNNLQKAEEALADQEAKNALQRQQNSLGIIDAQTRLDDLLEKQRIAQGGERDPQAEAARRALQAEQDIAKARLAVAQQIQKAKDDEIAATQRAADQAIAAETAQLNLAKARQQQTEDQKNSVANLVGFVNELSAGITNSGREVNRTVENIFTGIVASAGGLGSALGQIGDDIGKVASPTVNQVLLKTADVMKNLTNNTERQALATKLLGRAAGQELVSFLAQGSEAIIKFQKSVQNLGLVFSTEMAERTQAFRRALFTLEDTLSRIKDQIGAVFAPTFAPFFTLFNNLLTENRLNLLIFAQVLADAVQPTLESVIRVLSGAPDQVKDKWLLDLIAGFKSFGDTLKDIVIPVLKSFVDVVGFVAGEINNLFGTNLDAVSLLFVLWLGKVLGVFKLFTAALAVLEGALIAFGARAGLALAPMLLAFTAGFAAVLGILALVDKKTQDALLAFGNRLADLGEKVIGNFTGANKDAADESGDAWKSATDKILDLELKAKQMGEDGANAGEKTAAGFDKATASIKQTGQALQQTSQSAAGAAGKFVPEVFQGVPTAQFATLQPGGQVQRQSLQDFGKVGSQQGQAQVDQTSKAVQQSAQTGGQAAVAAFQQAADQIEAIWNSLKDTLEATDFSNLVDAEDIAGPFQDAEEAIDDVFNAIAQSAQRMAESIKQAAQDAAQAIAAIGGGAGGGHVWGPGSETSDSIWAKLSRNEFVEPASRVRQYGLDFMEAIRHGLISTDAVRMLMGDMRGFRYGGSVSVPRFAEGGAVGGTRTLVLDLNGRRFQATGQANVIDTLEREVALREMASAGIPQSFVGRRPT